MDEPIWVPTVFTKNRDRLLNQEVARQFVAHVVDRAAAWMSDEHFTVDGTLIEAWASHKSFQAKDGPPEGDGRNFHGQTRTNDTHASKTDPDARLYRKSGQTEASLAYLGHVLMENRHGLIVNGMATTVDGHAERDAALLMLQQHARPSHSATVGADKLFDTRDFVDVARQLGYTPHVSQHVKRTGGSAIDRRTTRHAGYATSQACRPRIERVFGWLKPLAGLRKVKLRGLDKVDSLFVFACAAFNLRRLPRLIAMAATPACLGLDRSRLAPSARGSQPSCPVLQQAPRSKMRFPPTISRNPRIRLKASSTCGEGSSVVGRRQWSLSLANCADTDDC